MIRDQNFCNIIHLVQCRNGPAQKFLPGGRKFSIKPQFHMYKGLEAMQSLGEETCSATDDSSDAKIHI